MKQFAFFLTFLCIVFLACEHHSTSDDNVGKLEVLIKVNYDKRPLVFGEDNNYYNGNDQLQISRLAFFMHNAILIGNTHSHPLVSIKYLDFSETLKSLTKSEAGYLLSFDDVDAGSFTGLDFGIGVPSDVNIKGPSGYTLPDPLAEGENYWAGWNSYIFSKIEGKYLNNANSIPFVYHSGFDEAYRKILLRKSITIKSNQTTRVELVLDIKSAFGDDKSYMDIASDNVFHDLRKGVMLQFMDYFQKAFELK